MVLQTSPKQPNRFRHHQHRRRTSNRSGLRELLIADREYRLPGCPRPGPWAARRGGRDELLEELKAGGPVVVGAADLMCAPMHAGMDCRRHAFGGSDAEKTFVLTERDELLPHDG
jgi:hypothetical protein